MLSKRDVEEMSVKQIMVCDHEDNGCNTSNMYTAYDWIGENGGLSTRKGDSIVPGEVQDDDGEVRPRGEALADHSGNVRLEDDGR